MNLTRTWSVATKECRELRRDPLFVVLAFVVPVGAMIIYDQAVCSQKLCGMPRYSQSLIRPKDQRLCETIAMCSLHTTGVLNCKQLPDIFTHNEPKKVLNRRGEIDHQSSRLGDAPQVPLRIRPTRSPTHLHRKFRLRHGSVPIS